MFINSVRVLLSSILLLAPGLVLNAAPKIGVLLKGRTAFWSAAEKGALEAGQKLGAEVIVKAPTNETDVAIQIQLLNALVNQGVEAIAIVPTNKDALAQPVAAAAAKGIKIVVLDSPLSGSASGSVFVGTDHHAAGEAAGQLVAGLVSDDDEVCILKHMQGSGATEARELGALDKLRELHPKLVIHGDIYASSESGAEVDRSKLLLSKYPKTKAILATGTPGTLAMLSVLKAKQNGGAIKFVGFGFNLNPTVAGAIEDGTMVAWVAQQPKEVGAKGVECACDLLAGKTLPATVHTDFVVVTKANLKDPKIQALLSL